MSLFRSEEMGYYNLILPHESVWEILNELGEVGVLQFVDQNISTPHLRSEPIIEYIRRCEGMQKKLGFIEHEMKQFKKPVMK